MSVRSPPDQCPLSGALPSPKRTFRFVGESRGPPARPARLTNVVLLAASRACPQLFQNLVHAEAARFLARREFLERGQELADDRLRGHTDKCMVEPPVVIRVRCDVRPFIRIGPQIEEFRKPQRSERLTPNPQ